MSNKATEETMDMGEAPENREKEYIKPGFRKLTITGFEYKPADAGKTPLITMKATGTGEDGTDVEFAERFYISGKKNKEGKWSSVLRLQELYKGFTGEPKMAVEPRKFNYTKAETDGSKKDYTIPHPEDLNEYLNKKLKGKTAVFKVGGEENEDGKVFSKLAYSQFLYYADKKGDIHRYKDEGDFSDAEYKYNVQKKKSADAPAHAGGVANTSQLDEL